MIKIDILWTETTKGDAILQKFTRQAPLLAGLALFFIALAIAEHLISLEQIRHRQTQQLQHQTAVSLVRARLESEINSTMFLALGLSSFVAASPDFTPAQFEQMAAMLTRMRPAIRNVALAPDNVIRHIYPQEGNRQALGMRYLEHPIQRAAVLRVMAEKQPIITGPFTLVQGGQGLINRIPIYPSDPQGGSYFWGLASVVVDPAPIYTAAGLDDPSFMFALRGKDARGAEGEVIRGDATLFADPLAVVMDVAVPGGRWQLAGRPTTAGAGLQFPAVIYHAVAWLVALLCGLMTWLTLRANQRIRSLALHDALTGIPNRRYLERVAGRLIAQARRSGRPFSLLHIDIDDFKLINDRHGHQAGDKALMFAARQAHTTLREADFVARVGGDEFIALLPETGSDSYLDSLLCRLQQAMCRPFIYNQTILSLQVSIGWATFPDEGQDLCQLIANADRKMYQQKAQPKTFFEGAPLCGP